MHRSPWLFFGVQIAFFVFPSVIHSSHSADFKVLIWKSGPAKVGETITFSAEVVLRPEARTKRNTRENLTYEFSWKVSSRPWVKHQKTTQRWDSFPCQWTQAGDKTILVYVRILDDNNGPDSRHGHRFCTGYSSYYARNETKVIVSETEGNNLGPFTVSYFKDILSFSLLASEGCVLVYVFSCYFPILQECVGIVSGLVLSLMKIDSYHIYVHFTLCPSVSY